MGAQSGRRVGAQVGRQADDCIRRADDSIPQSDARGR